MTVSILAFSAIFGILIGTIIVHEAWGEPDSANPNEVDGNSSLHRQGLEAIISVSEVILTLPTIEHRDYESDNSLLTTLASFAACVGFDFVRMNPSSNTLSVAVRECFDSQTR
jgi:predicted Rossmann fold nucleotide-binding protein DprA/Smf involved in DNA uptake